MLELAYIRVLEARALGIGSSNLPTRTKTKTRKVFMEYPKRCLWVKRIVNKDIDSFQKSILFKRAKNLSRRSIQYQLEVIACLVNHLLETQPEVEDVAEDLSIFLDLIPIKMKWYFTFNCDDTKRTSLEYIYISFLNHECFKYDKYRDGFYTYLADHLISDRHIYDKAEKEWKGSKRILKAYNLKRFT